MCIICWTFTEENKQDEGKYTYQPIINFEYKIIYMANMNRQKIKLIDLGLPSGTLWADRNLGANAPEKFGDYYRFGETTPFTENSPEYIYDDINESIAGSDRDAATVNLDKNYRMPSVDQIKEILKECKWKWTKYNDVNGKKVTGPNGNSIFFPASGYRLYCGGKLVIDEYYGSFWSASPYSNYFGHALYFNSYSWHYCNSYRNEGLPVRPVSMKDRQITENMKNIIILTNKELEYLYSLNSGNATGVECDSSPMDIPNILKEIRKED